MTAVKPPLLPVLPYLTHSIRTARYNTLQKPHNVHTVRRRDNTSHQPNATESIPSTQPTRRRGQFAVYLFPKKNKTIRKKAKENKSYGTKKSKTPAKS